MTVGLTPALEADLEAFRSDTAERLARLKPADTIKGLFINRYLEVFRSHAGDAFVARCYAVMGHPHFFDLINYPYSVLVRLGPLASRELVPKFGSVHRWLWELGREATDGYLSSTLGRAFLATFRPSPKTMLTGMPWAIATCFTFGKRTVIFTGESSAIFRCRFEYSPAPANAGAVQCAVEASGGRDVRVEINPFDVFNYDLEISWTSQ